MFSPTRRRLRAVSPRPFLQVGRVLLAVVLVGLLAGCQVKVAVDAKVSKDGSGSISVGVGLDDKAVAAAGDLNLEVKIDDLEPAGWTVTKANREADGFTWIRASKPFNSEAELDAVMREVVDPKGMFPGFELVRTETELDITYHLTGVIDGSKGMAQFSDSELQAKLNGDPFGGLLPKIEAREGKPIADMVSFDVTVALADAPAKTFHPTLSDSAPLAVDLVSVETKPPPVVQSVGLFVVIAVVFTVIVMMLVGARRRFTHAPTS